MKTISVIILSICLLAGVAWGEERYPPYETVTIWVSDSGALISDYAPSYQGGDLILTEQGIAQWKKKNKDWFVLHAREEIVGTHHQKYYVYAKGHFSGPGIGTHGIQAWGEEPNQIPFNQVPHYWEQGGPADYSSPPPVIIKQPDCWRGELRHCIEEARERCTFDGKLNQACFNAFSNPCFEKTVKWTGRLIETGESSEDCLGFWIKRIELGLRSDGIIVWRTTKSLRGGWKKQPEGGCP